MALAGLVLLLGCSSKPPGASVPQESTLLADVNGLLRAGGAPGRLPAKLSDVEKAKEFFPRGYDVVKSGEVVVLWGASVGGEGDIASGNEKVVAYEKKVPTEGGFVLMSAGSVKKMTAEEFKAAPKAATH
jgi:hypothetical protein